MLADLMGLPFRRDALEKTIRDALRRGKQPTLPMLGQLAAGIGPSRFRNKNFFPRLCTRLNVPCNQLNNSFGLVVQSNKWSVGGPPTPWMARVVTRPGSRANKGWLGGE